MKIPCRGINDVMIFDDAIGNAREFEIAVHRARYHMVALVRGNAIGILGFMAKQDVYSLYLRARLV